MTNVINIKAKTETQTEKSEKPENSENSEKKTRYDVLAPIALNQFIQRDGGFAVIGENSLYYKVNTGDKASAMPINYQQFRMKYPEFGRYDDDVLYAVVRKAGRCFDAKVSTLARTASNIYNVVEEQISHTLELGSAEAETPKEFEALFYSLGGFNETNAEKFQEIMAFGFWRVKNRVPNTKAPIMAVSGKGSNGKNLLAEAIAPVLFGHDSTAVITADDVLGEWSGTYTNKFFVLVNEYEPKNKHQGNRILKSLTDDNIKYNDKFEKPYNAENMAIYMVGSNDFKGAIELTGEGSTGTDRRWQISMTKGTLFDAMQAKGVDVGQDSTSEEYRNALAVLKNPENIKIWMKNLLRKYSDHWEEVLLSGATPAVYAVRTAAYDESLKAQESDYLMFVREVLMNDGTSDLMEYPEQITQIRVGELWDKFQQALRDKVIVSGGSIGRNTFVSRVRELVATDSEVSKEYEMKTTRIGGILTKNVICARNPKKPTHDWNFGE